MSYEGGLVGPTGPAGSGSGSTGYTGYTGYTGNVGSTGYTGYTGTNGTSAITTWKATGGLGPHPTFFCQSADLVVGNPITIYLAFLANTGNPSLFIGTLTSNLATGLPVTLSIVSTDGIETCTIQVSSLTTTGFYIIVGTVLSTGGPQFTAGKECSFISTIRATNPPLYGLVSIAMQLPPQSTYFIPLSGTAVTANSIVNTLLQIPDGLTQTWIVNAFPAVSAGMIPYIQIDFSNVPTTDSMVVAWSVVSYTSTTVAANVTAPA